MPKENQPIDELEGLMRKAADNAKEIIRISQEGIRSDQQILDLADAGLGVLKYPVSGNVDWESSIEKWQRTNDLQANRIKDLRALFETNAYASAASNTATAMVQFSDPVYAFKIYPYRDGAAAELARKHLRNVIDQSIDKIGLIALMYSLGLQKQYPNERSAVDQLEIAWAAYDMPLTQSTPVNTSLVPMRESIETAITELIRRRPRQEPAGSWRAKVISIGNQVAFDGIIKQDVLSWADQWDQLEPLLSNSKKRAYSREEWLDLLRRATLFLQSFLLGLDPQKLKP